MYVLERETRHGVHSLAVVPTYIPMTCIVIRSWGKRGILTEVMEGTHGCCGGGEPTARGRGQVRVLGRVWGQSGTEEVGAHRIAVREGDRDSLYHGGRAHGSPHWGSLLHRQGRHIPQRHPTEGEADAKMASTQRDLVGLSMAPDRKRAGTRLDLRCHATRMGGPHQVLATTQQDVSI